MRMISNHVKCIGQKHKQIQQKKKETKEYTIGQLAEILGHNIKIIE
jgi:hypothetical protein